MSSCATLLVRCSCHHCELLCFFICVRLCYVTLIVGQTHTCCLHSLWHSSEKVLVKTDVLLKLLLSCCCSDGDRLHLIRTPGGSSTIDPVKNYAVWTNYSGRVRRPVSYCRHQHQPANGRIVAPPYGAMLMCELPQRKSYGVWLLGLTLLV